jgi:hypothetical protein
MVGVARHASLFTVMADMLAPISAKTAVSLKNSGVSAVGRYVETLSGLERDDLFAAGLGILPLSKAPASTLNEVFGQSRAASLLNLAASLEIPTGVHFMVDFEAQNGTHVDIVAYDTILTAEIARASYIPLAYVGVPQPLSAIEIFNLPDVHLYWRGGSLGVIEPSCGFAIWQIPPLEQIIAGINVDISITGADLRGRRPILWWPE